MKTVKTITEAIRNAIDATRSTQPEDVEESAEKEGNEESDLTDSSAGSDESDETDESEEDGAHAHQADKQAGIFHILPPIKMIASVLYQLPREKTMTFTNFH